MALEVVRRIRDNLHGTIDITELEDAILRHPYVQRLRRIKQLAFLHLVFPGATHTRFEHSLGVMHLASVAWEKLHTNQARLAQSMQKFPNFAALERSEASKLQHGLLAPTFNMLGALFTSDYNLQLIRLAGLLHDLGHPSFSHSGERFMPSWKEVLDENPDSPSYLLDYLKQHVSRLEMEGRDPAKVGVRHEIFSILMADRVLRDTYQRFPKIKLKVETQDLISVIAPGIRPSDHSPILSFGLYKLMNELVSGELDIDRMDYLQRDSKECGVVYGIFDVSRIWDSLLIYHDEADNGVHAAISFSGLAAFEDYLRARYSMYLQVYFHKTAVAAEAMMQRMATIMSGWRFPARVADYSELDEYSVGGYLLDAEKKLDLSELDRSEFRQSLRDLLYNRGLWKRVFEISGTGMDLQRDVEPQMLKAAKILADLGTPYESISSSSSLTRFRTRDDDRRSRNYLRLVKKGPRQFPVVVPIEDHMSVLKGNQPTSIHRLYVPDHLDDSGNSLAEQMKQRIFERIQL